MKRRSWACRPNLGVLIFEAFEWIWERTKCVFLGHDESELDHTCRRCEHHRADNNCLAEKVLGFMMFAALLFSMILTYAVMKILNPRFKGD